LGCAVADIVQRSEILAACAIIGFQIAIIRDAAAPHRWWQLLASVVGRCLAMGGGGF